MTVYKGWNAKLLKDGCEIGYATEVRVEIDHSLEYYFEAGNRLPARIIEGAIEITGRFSRAWIDRTYLSLLQNTSVLCDFTLEIRVPDSHKLTLYNVKLRKGAIVVPQDGYLKEDYDFSALSFNVEKDCPSGEQIQNGGFETGDFTGWTIGSTKAGRDPPTIVHAPGDGAKGTDYWARLVNTSYGYVEQSLANDVPSGCIQSFKFYMKGTYNSCLSTGAKVKVTITYTDTTTTVFQHEVSHSQVWEEVNVKPHLVSGETVKKIRVEPTTNYTTDVDEFTCTSD